MKKKVIVGVVLVLVVVALIVANVIRAAAGGGEPVVRAVKVKKETVTGTVSLSGQVDLAERTEVRPPVAATLKELKVAVGDEVEADTVVAVVESRELLDQLQQAQQAYDEAVKKYEEAKKKQQSGTASQSLTGITLPNQTNLTGGQGSPMLNAGDLAAAEAEMKTAKANLDRIKKQVDQCTLRAGAAGRVLAINYRPGQRVSPEGAVVVIGDLNNLVVRAKVSESDVLRVKKGLEARISCDALPDRTYRGEVVEVALIPAGSTQGQVPLGAGMGGDMGAAGIGGGQGEAEYEVLIKVLDSDTSLRPGFNVSVDVVTEKKEGVLAVPVEAVLEMDFGKEEGLTFGPPAKTTEKEEPSNRKKVYLLGAGNTVEEREVRIGVSGDEWIEIVSGLKEGDRVVLSPDGKTVRPGVKVKVND